VNGEALRAYTREILSFSLGRGPDAVEAPGQDDRLADRLAQKLAQKLVESLERSGRMDLVLLGLGSGRVALALDRLLPPDRALVVCEADPESARHVLAQPPAGPGGAALLPGPGAASRLALLADASPWALFLLLSLHGPDPGRWLVAENPELSPEGKKPLAPLRRLLARTRRVPLAPALSPGLAAPASGFPERAPDAPGLPGLTFAAILRPDEPGLADFLASVPPLAREAVLLWDAPTVPENLPPVGLLPPERVRHLARPLAHSLDRPGGRDFAAQRNALLAGCGQDWVLTLDGDERLDPELAARLPALISRADVSGYLFQRRTLYPDPEHCKAGYGLWPDLQLRLFRRLPGLAYERPVHEVLTGLAPPLGLPLSGSILHFNSLGRAEGAIRDKLALFDAASGGGVRHALSAEYPSLPLALLDPAPGQGREPDTEEAAPPLLLLDQLP
jgi:hypothetical protein